MHSATRFNHYIMPGGFGRPNATILSSNSFIVGRRPAVSFDHASLSAGLATRGQRNGRTPVRTTIGGHKRVEHANPVHPCRSPLYVTSKAPVFISMLEMVLDRK